MKINTGGPKIVIGLVIVLGLLLTYLPAPVFSQQASPDSNIQNLLVNGGFEGGFQEGFGIGYSWGGFSNGNAVVGWNFDDWEAVVVEGKYAQRIEIKDAVDRDRYAGIYQTIAVVPGQQYKLTIKGLIRSEEGEVAVSDYGYRLQYAVDYNGDTAWELISEDDWQELPWDEQSLSEPAEGAYRFDTFETTITARGDKLTLFIRGWKKWINNGSGIYDLDAISFVGPAPEGFQAPVPQPVSVDSSNQQPAEETVAADASTQVSEHDGDPVVEESQPSPQAVPQTDSSPQAESSAQQDTSVQTDVSAQSETSPQADASTQTEVSAQTQTAPQTESQLPVSGQSSGDSNLVIIVGVFVLLALFAGAIAATMRRRSL